MQTRRTLLMFAAASILTMLGRSPVQAEDTVAAHENTPPVAAAVFIQKAGDRLVGIINKNAPIQQKRAALQQIVDDVIDVDQIGRFCLGTFWNKATPDQQAEYMRLFHTVLLNNINSKLGEYNSLGFTVGRAMPRAADTVAVNTTIVRPNNAPNDVEWIVEHPVNAPKIVDVFVEGTSLRLTQRSDYRAYLAHNHNDVGVLISAMKQQVGG